jgi:hypothetical protein
MFIESQRTDPAVHALCIKIARRCAAVIEPLLRQEEIREALTECYRVCREEMSKTPTPPEV